MAEGLFRRAVSGRDDYAVGSAGVAAYPGSPMSGETQMVLRARSGELEGFESQPVSRELIERATHVFAMTGGHLAALTSQFPDQEEKFFLVCEFVEIPGRGHGCDVPDPIGMGAAAYLQVAETLDLAIPSIIGFIDQTSVGGEA